MSQIVFEKADVCKTVVSAINWKC